MPGRERLVVRPSAVTVMVIFVNACFLSLVLLGAALAVALHRRHAAVIWIAVAAVAVIWTIVSIRAKASFDQTGIRARNAIRSFSARWDEVVAIRLIPAVWYCADPGWAATMLEVTRRDGQRSPLRSTTHLSRSKAESLGELLSSRAAEYGFETPPSLLPLWKAGAVKA